MADRSSGILSEMSDKFAEIFSQTPVISYIMTARVILKADFVVRCGVIKLSYQLRRIALSVVLPSSIAGRRCSSA